MTSDGRYSEVTEETYCTYDCLDDAESTYKRENWYYSYYDEEYYENEEDITYFYEWNSGLVNMKEKPYQRYLLMNFGKKENFIVLETICLT